MLMTISYGKGRVFHTVLGHSVVSIQCVGFAYNDHIGLLQLFFVDVIHISIKDFLALKNVSAQ